jgi:hypothetical protein
MSSRLRNLPVWEKRDEVMRFSERAPS